MSGSSGNRTDRLTALQQALDTWCAKQTENVQKIIASQKKILDARGSPSAAANKGAQTVVVDQLSDFLKG